ncbi:MULTISPECIES: hypothetical protein [unclassified Streptomyces]|uniref:hypothetical protein n=1 Tax=unclassified Streptomyces TaxID=2593676 RepID=UPI0004C1A18C|nr:MULTISPECIES: hypothetical protein [unclassified Streptomyces]
MTQSGQGGEPSARPAREGIVLPSDGGAPLLPGSQAEPPAPAGGRSWGGPWGPDQQAAPAPPPAPGWGEDPGPQWGAPGGAQLPPESAQASPGGAHPGHGVAPHAGHAAATGGYSAPLPPAAPPGAQPQPYPSGSGAFPSAPLPATNEGATQYLQSPADEGATQYIPPVMNEGATQYIPPVTDEGATQYIPPVPGGAGPMPPAAGPDAQATQYLPPVPGGGAPAQPAPPAEFDNLFRTEGAPAPAPATEQLPQIGEAVSVPPPGGGRAGARRGGDEGGGNRGVGGGRSGSRVPLIAAIGVGIVVLGIGAGALLGGGGDSKGDDSKNVSATGPATADSSAPAADPAKAQADALDKLLAESGNSRQSVIGAVANVRACKNLDQSATDLRSAAKQRNGLVTKLSGLAVDKLPDHAALTASLTAAWRASASADNHYAAWADQAKGKKVCKKGHARTTNQTVAGNTASGTATEQKKKAAALWNAIASKYGLTQRQPTQL